MSEYMYNLEPKILLSPKQANFSNPSLKFQFVQLSIFWVQSFTLFDGRPLSRYST